MLWHGFCPTEGSKLKILSLSITQWLGSRQPMRFVELGFKVFPPLLGRGAGRPKVQRHRCCLEKRASKKTVKCRRCEDFGHFSKTCKETEIREDGERAPPRNKANKRYVFVH